MSDSFYSLSGVLSDGSIIATSGFEGKVVYATNVASMWGETEPGYALFRKLGKKYGPQKLVILAFPSQEFAMEEFGTDSEIASFAAARNFPGFLMKLGSVLGERAPEIWKHMRNVTGSSDPSWNFASAYLVSKSGKVSVARNVEKDIEALVAAEN